MHPIEQKLQHGLFQPAIIQLMLHELKGRLLQQAHMHVIQFKTLPIISHLKEHQQPYNPH